MDRMSVKRLLPSSITLFNILCGFLAVVNVIEGTPRAMVSAAWWIIIAAILDALDGKVARLTGTSSEFGIEFDSIADVVSFGLAPAVMFYQYALADAGRVGLMLGFLFLAAGAFRLARFNVTATTGPKGSFTGMPIPSAAGILASYILFTENVWSGFGRFEFAAVLVILTSLAMVSRYRYSALPKVGFRSPVSTFRSALFLGNIVLIAILPDETLFLEGLLYLASGPVRFFTGPVFVQVFHRTNQTGIK